MLDWEYLKNHVKKHRHAWMVERGVAWLALIDWTTKPCICLNLLLQKENLIVHWTTLKRVSSLFVVVETSQCLFFCVVMYFGLTFLFFFGVVLQISIGKPTHLSVCDFKWECSHIIGCNGCRYCRLCHPIATQWTYCSRCSTESSSSTSGRKNVEYYASQSWCRKFIVYCSNDSWNGHQPPPCTSASVGVGVGVSVCTRSSRKQCKGRIKKTKWRKRMWVWVCVMCADCRLSEIHDTRHTLALLAIQEADIV